MSSPHPYCAIAVALVPLAADGQPQLDRTVTLIGTGAVKVGMDGVEIEWREDRVTGARFVLSGDVGGI